MSRYFIFDEKLLLGLQQASISYPLQLCSPTSCAYIFLIPQSSNVGDSHDHQTSVHSPPIYPLNYSTSNSNSSPTTVVPVAVNLDSSCDVQPIFLESDAS